MPGCHVHLCQLRVHEMVVWTTVTSTCQEKSLLQNTFDLSKQHLVLSGGFVCGIGTFWRRGEDLSFYSPISHCSTTNSGGESHPRLAGATARIEVWQGVAFLRPQWHSGRQQKLLWSWNSGPDTGDSAHLIPSPNRHPDLSWHCVKSLQRKLMPPLNCSTRHARSSRYPDVPSQRITDFEAAIRQMRQLSLDNCTIPASYEVSQARKAILLMPRTAKGASTSSEELNAQISPRTDDEHNLPKPGSPSQDPRDHMAQAIKA